VERRAVGERSRSTLRTAVVWDALHAALQAHHQAVGQRPLRVVDLGGGTGGLAVRIAQLGHVVTVVDPSPDALASLERRAAEVELSLPLRGVLGDAASLPDVVEADIDVVVCHGVLEVVDEPAQALQSAAAVLEPAGLLSVLSAQTSGAVLTRALTGHLAEARTLLDQSAGDSTATLPVATGSPPRRFTRAELDALLTAAGFTVSEVRGIRVFVDHISSAVVDSDPAAAEALGALEMAAATHPDFMAVATQLHLLATRSS